MFDKDGPTMVFYHDGNRFWPIYKVKKDRAIGMFDANSDFIKKL